MNMKMSLLIQTSFILVICIHQGTSREENLGPMPFYGCIRKDDGDYRRVILPCTVVKEPDNFGYITANDMMVPRGVPQFCCVPHVIVRVGQHAILPCNLTKNLGVAERVTWFKGSTYSRPVQVIDGTATGSIHKGVRKYNSKKYDDRLSQPEEWEWDVDTLVLTNARMNDTGSYFCVRQIRKSKAIIIPIYLEVSPGLLTDSLKNLTPFVAYNRDPEFISLYKKCLPKLSLAHRSCLSSPGGNTDSLFMNDEYDNFKFPVNNWPWSEDMTYFCTGWPIALQIQFQCATDPAIWLCDIDEAEAFVYSVARRWQRYCQFDIYKEPTEHYCGGGANRSSAYCDKTFPPLPLPNYDYHNDYAKVWQLDPSVMPPFQDYCNILQERFWCMIQELQKLDPNCVHPDLKLTAYVFVPLYIKVKKACIYVPDYYFMREKDLSDLYLATQKTCAGFWKDDVVETCNAKGNTTGGDIHWSRVEIGHWIDKKHRDEHAYLCCEAYKIISCYIRIAYQRCDVEDARRIHMAKFEEITHNCGFVSRIDCFPSVNKDNA